MATQWRSARSRLDTGSSRGSRPSALFTACLTCGIEPESARARQRPLASCQPWHLQRPLMAHCLLVYLMLHVQ